MDENINGASGEAFIKFWIYVSEKNLMNPNTARSLAIAAKAVLSVENGWEEINIANIDVEEFIRRFEIKHARDYTPKTLAVYGRRFKRALSDYLDYSQNPAGWRPRSSKKQTTKKGNVNRKDKATSEKLKSDHETIPVSTFDPNLKLITYPFMLRNDCVVQLRLPTDLTKADVERLTVYLNTLIPPSQTDEDREITDEY